MALPSEYTFGKVVTRIVQAVADGSDEDRFPDMLAAGGYVLFKPHEKNRKTVNYSALVLNQNIRGILYVPDPNAPESSHVHPPGTLMDPQGNVGVWLVTGNYTAEFHLNEGSYPPVQFTLTDENDSDNPLDLIHASPTEPPQGVVMVQADIPPGGRPDQTLVRDETGTLTWQNILDDETAWRAEKAAQDASEFLDQTRQVASTVPNIFIQDTPPENPKEGDLWLDTTIREL